MDTLRRRKLGGLDNIIHVAIDSKDHDIQHEPCGLAPESHGIFVTVSPLGFRMRFALYVVGAAVCCLAVNADTSMARRGAGALAWP